MAVKILGIDPGSLKAGYALLLQEGRHFRYVDSGVFIYPGQAKFLARLNLIYNSFAQLLELYHPDEVALESLVFVKSPTSLIKLAQARGIMLAALRAMEGKIYEYSPNLVKSSVTGHGLADKASVQKSLNMILGLSREKKHFQTFDESDALAVALCHGLHRKDVYDRPSPGSRPL